MLKYLLLSVFCFSLSIPGFASVCGGKNEVNFLGKTYCEGKVLNKAISMSSPNPGRTATGTVKKLQLLDKEGNVIGTTQESEDSNFFSITVNNELSSVVYHHATVDESEKPISADTKEESKFQKHYVDVAFSGKDTSNKDVYKFNLNNWSETHDLRGDKHLVIINSPFTLTVDNNQYSGLFEGRLSYPKENIENKFDGTRKIAGAMTRSNEDSAAFSLYWDIDNGIICIKEISTQEWISEDTDTCDAIEAVVSARK